MTKGILRMTLKTVIAGSAFVLACVIAFAVGQAQQKTSTLTPADKLEIQELLARYMFVLDSCPDHNNGYDYADLYTEDGAFGNNKGREALARAAGRTSDGNCNANRQRGENNELHINVAPIIVPTPEGARGTSYLMMIQGPANQIYFAGWYEDTYVKTAKGWRFKTRDHVSGLRAGIPANAGAIRNEMTRLAKDNLAKNPPTTANAGGRGPATPPPPPHDPLNWVDGKVKQVAAR